MAKDVKKKVAKKPGKERADRLTIPDLVILSLLAERAMHGYEVNATLENRNIREWAPVSRPQIYYSLDKLLGLALIRVSPDAAPAAGPERRVFETTETGLDLLADALERSSWVRDTVYQPFLIWLALSWQARGATFKRQLNDRKTFLEALLEVEKATLKDVLEEVGHPWHEAVWMIELKIEQSEVELRWVEKILADADKRQPARGNKDLRDQGI
jgi:DNA-binding PadR family transcriptional regulator